MVGSVSLLGKAAGEVSAGHWSEETLQTQTARRNK